MTSRYADLERSQLATLLPELLLAGQLIDRSAMAWCISAFGREEMSRIAIEEWMAASPIYTRRMQRVLGYQGDDVVTIFKGLQLDIGAPPQFMDFRYTVHDPWHGEFHLDHCGALMDVEPMGDRYVRSMCHDIEDPTFDATAVATNPKAQVRPVHRPPREPATAPAPACAQLLHPFIQKDERTPRSGGATPRNRRLDRTPRGNPNHYPGHPGRAGLRHRSSAAHRIRRRRGRVIRRRRGKGLVVLGCTDHGAAECSLGGQ